MNGRPLGLRQRIRLLVALTILAWATQTLLHQWGFGAEPKAAEPTESFVPSPAVLGGSLELRGEATVEGKEIRFRQVFRWAGADDAAFAPMADLIVARFQPKATFQSIALNDAKRTLREAGVNLSLVRFRGPSACTVTRSDARPAEATALDEWAAQQQPVTEVRLQTIPAPQPDAVTIDDTPVRTLRQLLTADAAARLNLPVDSLQLTFNPKDEGVLNLSSPRLRFNLDPKRVRDLGSIIWEVTVFTDKGSRAATIAATAQAWRTEVVATKPLASKQVVQAGDVEERRVLADRLPSAPLLEMSQVVGQQTNRDVKPGTPLLATMVDAVPLVKQGQLVTVNSTVGNFRIRTVARAMEGGAFGESIHVRNETTRDVYAITLTGPQEGCVGPQDNAGAPSASARAAK